MKIIVTGGSGFIGTHLLRLLQTEGHQVLNLDIAPPQVEGLEAVAWRNCSLLDVFGVRQVFEKFQPMAVIHLAAHAAMEAPDKSVFAVNTEGTANLLAVIKQTASVERVIITSTQHVRKPGSGMPTSDTDYVPYLYYGETKVETERLTRAADLDCAWTIVRPTAVWGPGQLLLAEGMWKLMLRGRYFHPARDPVLRSYGYVKNVVWQLERLLHASAPAVQGRVLYVADGNSRQFEWVNALSRSICGREVPTLPLWFIRLLSAFGDVVKALGINFPIYRARLENLITNNPVPVEPIIDLLGQPPHSMEEGAEETAVWLKAYFKGKKQ